MTRRDVDKEIEPFEDIGGGEEYKMPLAMAIERLSVALASIPEEYRATAAFQIKGYGDYVSVYPSVHYTRPETDEEVAAREERDRRYKAEREASERETYKYLKQKLG